ncbi:hypothetical protein NM208_g10063 [Fusarium decemcellulare]|uniref:Uncharacterized protein n=1 Tax=Fusarium decemcellulare TaxID=57161 RepID=A0ACC1RZ72_9HYPO|nr:hypothetical protein NM208_g10063 [Fusarium decemcellulare]
MRLLQVSGRASATSPPVQAALKEQELHSRVVAFVPFYTSLFNWRGIRAEALSWRCGLPETDFLTLFATYWQVAFDMDTPSFPKIDDKDRQWALYCGKGVTSAKSRSEYIFYANNWAPKTPLEEAGEDEASEVEGESESARSTLGRAIRKY